MVTIVKVSVVMLCVNILSIIMVSSKPIILSLTISKLHVVMLGVFRPSIIKLSVKLFYDYVECRLTERRYTKYRHT